MGRNSQMKTEAEVMSERMKVFYCEKSKTKQVGERSKIHLCCCVTAAHTEEQSEALSRSKLLSNTAMGGMV